MITPSVKHGTSIALRQVPDNGFVHAPRFASLNVAYRLMPAVDEVHFVLSTRGQITSCF
jgi:hypothetical protein